MKKKKNSVRDNSLEINIDKNSDGSYLDLPPSSLVLHDVTMRQVDNYKIAGMEIDGQ